MQFKINDEKRELIYITEDGSEGVVKSFVCEKELKDRKYTLYAYVEVIDNNLIVKFGEAKKQSIYDRYNSTGHLANKHMIAVWESEKGDKEIHAELRKRAKNKRGYEPASFEVINTEEAYKVNSISGLNNLLDDITEYARGNVFIAKKLREDYPDIVNLVNEMLEDEHKYMIADLCTRWGKTATFLRLAKLYAERNERIFIIASYVGTVKHSYSSEIEELTCNDKAKFVDPDIYESNKEIVKDMKNWLSKNPNNYIVYYLALTGDEDSCFARRKKPLGDRAFENEVAHLVVEEADFGSTCEKQINKLKQLIA